MKKIIYTLSFFILLFSCKDALEKKRESTTVAKELKTRKLYSIPTYNYEELAPLLTKKDAKTYVVNFWATWCKPCVKELPAFEKLKAKYQDKNVEVILVSLDFPNQIESRLVPFIKKKGLKSKVVVMVDPDQDTWIPKISKAWSGAIPATLIYNKNDRAFYEQSFHYKALENELQKFLNQ